MMIMRIALMTGIAAAALAVAPALAVERCRVTDPTGTPLNVRDANMNIMGTIENARIVIIRRYGRDARGKPWAFVETPEGDPIGWVDREFVSCF
jgi:hypothetical protein